MQHLRRALLLAPMALLTGVRSAGAAPKVHVVRMAKMAFGPAPTGVRVGDIIEWVNADAVPHTATARNGSFDVDLKPGAKARTALRGPGVVAYYCRYHPGMTGRMVVAA